MLGLKFNLKKLFYIELTKIYGIGVKRSLKICSKLDLTTKKVFEINELEKIRVLKELKKYILGIDLKKNIIYNIKRLINIKCYRGLRHLKRLPARGQRTRTNAKTCRNSNLKIF